eukprot:COSAG01_NODE_485_length_16397_cov_48.193827_13_plen_72_part_00
MARARHGVAFLLLAARGVQWSSGMTALLSCFFSLCVFMLTCYYAHGAGQGEHPFSRFAPQAVRWLMGLIIM